MTEAIVDSILFRMRDAKISMLANEAGKIFLLASIQYDNQVRTNTNENNVHTGKCVDTENGKDGNKDNEPAFELCGVAWSALRGLNDSLKQFQACIPRESDTSDVVDAAQQGGRGNVRGGNLRISKSATRRRTTTTISNDRVWGYSVVYDMLTRVILAEEMAERKLATADYYRLLSNEERGAIHSDYLSGKGWREYEYDPPLIERLTMVIVIDGMMSAKEALNRSGITPRGWKYYEMTYPPPRSAISYSTQFKKNMPKTQSCPAPTIMP
ncbi:hypothetical protein TREMEDRAFT_58457 [Tremella mesenterica DSM 1558]|uniref:uncharacterized protein n=1 Tax=Tremella mesenterica (strain ATCC 24925 / CBS 8224 / DSM 1558 / NBRC 9311 / NRRL Y-6157 / RJB 2259-6 / UBC 559-6) TaxID=578456 RepID=UPI0003F4A172|nr:uncharacterized protein TREMEDRAFT_58457 [Tremella mesenterica DSM 1558]EIW72294.1 hypothetical protein TREMEDRAFT_58457 [Tremella mesenterica DSM 1558]